MARARGSRGTARRAFKNIPYGQAHIYATFNNTIISMTDQSGNVIAWASAGTSGFKGSRKNTPYAARMAAETAAANSQQHGMERGGYFREGTRSRARSSNSLDPAKRSESAFD